MIVEHICKGNKSTTLHNFVWSQTGMTVGITSGTYTQQNVVLYSSTTGANVTIPTPTVQTYYEIWLSNSGLAVLSRTDGQQFGPVTNPIDRLAWFTVPANTTTLDNVNIDVVRMQGV